VGYLVLTSTPTSGAATLSTAAELPVEPVVPLPTEGAVRGRYVALASSVGRRRPSVAGGELGAGRPRRPPLLAARGARRGGPGGGLAAERPPGRPWRAADGPSRRSPPRRACPPWRACARTTTLLTLDGTLLHASGSLCARARSATPSTSPCPPRRPSGRPRWTRCRCVPSSGGTAGSRYRSASTPGRRGGRDRRCAAEGDPRRALRPRPRAAARRRPRPRAPLAPAPPGRRQLPLSVPATMRPVVVESAGHAVSWRERGRERHGAVEDPDRPAIPGRSSRTPPGSSPTASTSAATNRGSSRRMSAPAPRSCAAGWSNDRGNPCRERR